MIWQLAFLDGPVIRVQWSEFNSNEQNCKGDWQSQDVHNGERQGHNSPLILRDQTPEEAHLGMHESAATTTRTANVAAVVAVLSQPRSDLLCDCEDADLQTYY